MTLSSSNETSTILNFMLKQDIISKTDVLDIELAMTKQEVLKYHKNKISLQTLKNGKIRYITRLPDSKNSQITATTESGLYSKLKDFYLVESFTLDSIYKQYKEFRISSNSVKLKTITEDQNIYNRFFVNSSIINTTLNHLTVKDYMNFFYSINTEAISKKSLGAIKSLVKRIYEYANMYLDIDVTCPLNKINFSSFNTKVVDNRNKVFTAHELSILCTYMDKLEHLDSYDYAIMLMCETITRIGEIKALKWSDVKSDYIWISSTIDSENNRLNRTKNKLLCGNRAIPLTERAKSILSKLNHNSEYIFTNKQGNLLTTDTFNRRLKKRCKECDIPYFSSHKIRFGNITRMVENKAPITDIQYYAGHSNISMTMNYVRSTQRPDSTDYKSTIVNTL